MLNFIHLIYALQENLTERSIPISVRNEPNRRLTLEDNTLKVKDSSDKVKLIQEGEKTYNITIGKKVVCHLTDNTANLCKNNYNRSKSWEFIPLKNKGYLIRSYTANKKSDRLCMKHDDISETVLLKKCDKYDDTMRWDVGTNDFKNSGYEIIN